ncbi:MAG: hypothetical protein A3J28_12945 [Acidobacteria bacterium RIFCSPLOWO2_12_FULL_60_22]|nr:MAG: hypothetical protein A3J28_12945 [Acidobacteria bacterium RIFCSPLOWO2_12_FULL_60_22]
MQHRILGLILATATGIAFALVMRAQTAAPSRAARAVPDLSGIWDNTHLDRQVRGPTDGPPGGFMGPGGIPAFGFTTEEPSMWPEAAEKFKAIRTGVVRGPLDRGNGLLDPGHYCIPYGPTRMYTTPRPWELRQLPDAALFLFELDHWVRRIYVNGRGHPEGYPITWMGHSIGKYDGDTLVVDTVGMHDESWLDHLGHVHSEAMHIVERFRRLDQDTLQIDLIFDDPKTYTKPWTGKKIFKRAPPNFDILEDVLCEEWLEMGKHRTPGVIQ